MEGRIDFAHVDLDRVLLPEGHLQVHGVAKEGRLVLHWSDVVVVVEPHRDHSLIWRSGKLCKRRNEKEKRKKGYQEGAASNIHNPRIGNEKEKEREEEEEWLAPSVGTLQEGRGRERTLRVWVRVRRVLIICWVAFLISFLV